MRLWGIAILAGIVVLGCSPNPLPGPVVDQQPTEQTSAASTLVREKNSNQVFSEQKVTLPNGAPGVLFTFEQLEGEVGVRCLITEVPATPILLCGLAWEFEFFESIAFSLRPL